MLSSTAILVLSICAAATAVACISADERGQRTRVYLCKPLVLFWILAVAALAPPTTSDAYRNLILMGLCFSLAGDVFLMLPSDRFVAGLSSFLVAHLLYIAAFAGGVSAPAWGVLAALCVFAVPMYGLLLPQLGGLRVPVALYITAIVGMAWQASARWLESGDLGALLACAGALLFVVSDAALAWNRFRGGFRHAQTLVLGSYFPAQWLIALSLGGGVLLFGSAGP
jgi:uncharacterized membrane protein YhhN